jgi:serine/threonine-protein kinase
VYGEKHYLIGIAESNLGGVYAERKQYVRAEQLFRDALQTYAKTLPPEHFSVGVSRIRLGGALLGQKRFVEAEAESRAGYQIVMKQTSPTVKWVQTARKDLAAEYEALKQPDKAAKFRAELAAGSKSPAGAVKK